MEKDIVSIYEYELMIDKLPERVGLHNRNHTERVLTLALLLAEESDLSVPEKEILYRSVVYHDAGRTNDAVDPDHGWGGYIEYIKNFAMNDVAEF